MRADHPFLEVRKFRYRENTSSANKWRQIMKPELRPRVFHWSWRTFLSIILLLIPWVSMYFYW